MFQFFGWILNCIRSALVCTPQPQQDQQDVADVDRAKLQARFDEVSRKSLDEFRAALRRRQKKSD